MTNLTIYNASGTEILTTPINEGSKLHYEIGKSHYMTLKFSLAQAQHFGVGCYVTYKGRKFLVSETQDPTYNTSTGGYDYELQFRADYWYWNNKICKFSPQYGGREASWNLTSTIATHAQKVLDNIEENGYNYNGVAYSVVVDDTVDKVAAKLVQYDQTGITDALTAIATAFECEWWVTDNIIHFGKCQDTNEPIDFIIGRNVEKISRSNSKSKYANRLYVFGGEQNLPKNYRRNESTGDVVVNGIVQRRLMLPQSYNDGKNYIDAEPNLAEDEIVEGVITLDDVFPRFTTTVD
jgi:hypothetical protein